MNALTREEEMAMPVRRARQGEVIWLIRGGSPKKEMTRQAGYLRRVRARFLCRRSDRIAARLLEDDPGSTVREWSKCGQTGWWSASSARKYDGPRKLARRVRGLGRFTGTRMW